MTYYKDFSGYEFFETLKISKYKNINIGWLEKGREFKKEIPSEKLLSILWDYCTISIMQSRGYHDCDFCDHDIYIGEERNNVKLALGSAEIRVFSKNKNVFCAPNLIYHYVKKHNYKLPDAFKRALIDSPKPFSDEYTALLNENKLEWNKTHIYDSTAKRISFDEWPE